MKLRLSVMKSSILESLIQECIDIGKDILISMESPKIPLNLKHVEKKIREYLI